MCRQNLTRSVFVSRPLLWLTAAQPCHSRDETRQSNPLCSCNGETALRKPRRKTAALFFSGTYAMAHQTPTVVVRGAICLLYGTPGPAICKPLLAPFLLPWAADRSRARRLRNPDTVAPAGPLLRRGLQAARSRAAGQTSVRRRKHPHVALHKRLVRREERLL